MAILEPPIAGAAVEERPLPATPTHGKPQVHTFHALDELERIRRIWTSWHRHPNSDFDFYQRVVRLRPEQCRPHVLLLTRDGRPETLLIGRSEKVTLESRFGYKTLSRLPARQLTFIYAGLLGNPERENCEGLFAEVMASLNRGEADVAEFHFIRTDSPFYGLARECEPPFSRDPVPIMQPHRSTELAASADEFYAKLSPKARKNQKYQARKLAQDFAGAVRIECFRRPEELDRMCADLEHVATKTYQRALGVGFVNNQVMRQQLLLEAERGWMRTYILYLQEKPAAFWGCSLYGDVLYSNFMGYDPAFAKHSPGMFLVMQTIEDLCSGKGDRAVRIDWGLGDAQYKEVLGDACWPEAAVRVFAPTLKGLGLSLRITPAAMADRFVRQVMTESGFLQAIKTRWRQRLRANLPPR